MPTEPIMHPNSFMVLTDLYDSLDKIYVSLKLQNIDLDDKWSHWKLNTPC